MPEEFSLREVWEIIWPRLREWLRQRRDDGRVLVLGAGGVGKTTFGRFLSGNADLLLAPPGPYDESIQVETFDATDIRNLNSLDIAPGQPHRRDATWDALLNSLSKGQYRGLIVVGAWGYHNHGIGSNVTYRDHPLYKGNKEAFLTDFLKDRREEELAVLDQISKAVALPPGRKFWLLSLVTKQDLWWNQRREAEDFYRTGEYARVIARMLNRHGSNRFRHEAQFVSLVINNFVTGRDEKLQTNTAGYDQNLQQDSLTSLIRTLESLREWEKST